METSQLIEAVMGAVQLQEGGADSATSGALGGAVTGADGSQGGDTSGGQTGGGGMQMMMLILLPMMLLLIFTSVLGGRKEKKKRAEMMASLKKHDKVQTIGGIIGTVMELTGDEVVLRVDETSKTRIRFSRSAIQQVLRGSGGGAEEKQPSEAVSANGVVEKATA